MSTFRTFPKYTCTLPANTNTATDGDDGTRSGTPTSIAPGESEATDEPHQQDTQDRHRELMSRIFPHGVEGPRAAEQFFPRHHDEDRVSAMKTESERDDSREASSHGGAGGGPLPPIISTANADVVMKETSEAQAQEEERERREREREYALAEEQERERNRAAAAEAERQQQQQQHQQQQVAAGGLTRMDESGDTNENIVAGAPPAEQPAAAA